MGILGDIVANRIDKIVNDRRQAKMEQQVSETQDIEIYNRIWLDKVVHETGYALTAGELEDAADETEDAKAEDTKTEEAAFDAALSFLDSF